MSFTGLLPQPPYPWLSGIWEGFISRVEQNRLPHALLVVGQSGLGCLDLARAMAQFLLCAAPRGKHSCGQCKACLLLAADGHPDLHMVQLEEESKAIKIAQIRAMTEFTFNTSQQGGRKLAIIHPAEAMNSNAANALLKSLEEPSGDCVYILVTEQPAFLMPTIRSRCSRLQVNLPQEAEALGWLERNRVPDAAELLRAASGRPLRVMEWLANDLWGQRKLLLQEISRMINGSVSFLDCAKNLLALGPLWVIEQLQVALVQAVRLRQAPVGGQGDDLAQELSKISSNRLLPLYDAVSKRKALLLSSANPNPQMLMDEIMMEIKDLYRKTD